MKTIKAAISNYKISDEDKYLSREFQKYGIYLADELGDPSHKTLYIKLAKEVPRPILDSALSFVLDSKARSKARLFMWKVKQLRSLGLESGAKKQEK